jgi:hypothetical protein
MVELSLKYQVVDMITEIVFGLMTLHTPAVNAGVPGNVPFNTDNEVVVLQSDHTFVGKMVNSYHKDSLFGGVKKSFTYGRFTFSGGVGVATGYPTGIMGGGDGVDLTKSQTIPMGVASVSYRVTDYFSLNAMTVGSAVNFGVGLRL